MQCPACKTDTIKFINVWFNGHFGRFLCPNCKTTTKLRKDPRLLAVSFTLGAIAVGFAIAADNVLVLILGLAVVLPIDYAIDKHSARLEIDHTRQ